MEEVVDSLLAIEQGDFVDTLRKVVLVAKDEDITPSTESTVFVGGSEAVSTAHLPFSHFQWPI
jgi:hypothetical protein